MNFNDLKQYKYCFLNVVYTGDDGKTKAFSIVLADESFHRVASTHVDLETLKRFAEMFTITDFDFSAGYFRCNPNVVQKKYNEVIAECLGQIITEEHDSYTFFDLLYEGQQNGFYIINDEYAECLENREVSHINAFSNSAKTDKQKETAADFYYISPFRSILFSQSSMTSYVRMYNSKGCYNKMLVTPVNHVPKLQSFFFIVPYEYAFERKNCNFIRSVELDGKKYKLFHVTLLSIYEMHTILSGALVNKAVSLRHRCYNACEALSAFQKHIWESLDDSAACGEKIAWIGGQKSYNDGYGVKFKTSMKMLTKIERDNLCEKVVDTVIRAHAPISKFKREIINSSMNSIEKYVCMNIILGLEYSACNENIDLLEAVRQVMHSQRDKLFLCDLYLYRIRLYLCISGETLVQDLAHPFLYGGNETAFTIVEGGRYYGAI